MKTCKKILAGVLVFAMMLSMCAFVSADEVAEAAENVLLCYTSFDGLDAGTAPKTVSRAAGVGPESHANYYTQRSNATGTSTIVHDAETGREYISTSSTKIGYNSRYTYAQLAECGVADYNLLKVSFDFMIPDDANVNTKRTHQFSNLGKVTQFVYENGRFRVATDSTNCVKIWDVEVDYTPGDWVNVALYSLMTPLDETGLVNTLTCALTVDDVVIAYYDYGTVTAAKDTTQAVGDNNTSSNGTALMGIDEFKFTLEKPSVMPELPVVHEADLMLMPADELETKSTTDGTCTYDEASGVLTCVGAKGGTALLKATGVATASLAQGKNTAADTKYTIDTTTTAGRSAFSMTSASRIYNTHNMRTPIKSFIADGNQKTLIFSYDMYVPAGSEVARREHNFSLGFDVSNAENGRKSSDLAVITVVENGEIGINVSTSNFGKKVEGSERAESREFTSNAWHTIMYLIDIQWNEAEKNYTATTYGIFDGDVISTESSVLTDIDDDEYSVAGEFDNLKINTQAIDITVPSENTTEFTTLFDNFSFVLNDYFDRTNNVDFDAWVNRIIEVSKDASGNIDVYAKKAEGTFTNETLVIAICNAKGKVKEVLTSKKVVDGTMSYEVPASKVVAGDIVKAFVFDSLTSAVPQMPKGLYIVK